MNKMSKQQYIQLDPIEHILQRPDMYVGSNRIEEKKEYVYDLTYITTNKMTDPAPEPKIVLKQLKTSPAFLRTFKEILYNAIDNVYRPSKVKRMTYLSIHMSPEKISICNDGAVIPINKDNDKQIYNHSLIFGHLLSGSNYDDTEKRFTSGRNGLGAKLTNVLSSEFTVEAVDPELQLKLTQTWKNNMKHTDEPILKKCTLKNGYTLIEWNPDLKWFGIPSITVELMEYFCICAFNAAMTTQLRVELMIKYNNIKNRIVMPKSISMYFGYMHPAQELLKLENSHSQVMVSPAANDYECFSFVNGIETRNGGKHVTAWIDAVFKPILEKLQSKKSKDLPKLTIKDLKPFFRFLIITKVANPEFESQEKNELKTNVSVEPITSSQVTKILQWSIGESLKSLLQSKEKKITVKELMASKNKHIKIDGYDRANFSGGSKSKQCSLIICEGLSAKTFCVRGIEYGIPGFQGQGRDFFGIYPLRGKILNTRNATQSMICKNTVINNLVNILGLAYGKKVNVDKLHYGRVIILTDADSDGIHIEGLLLNFFNTMFPELLSQSFVFSMKTPIVMGLNRYFFDEREWKLFLSANAGKLKEVKYHKGLGTIKQDAVKHVFGKKMLQFVEDDKSNKSFTIAFGKDHSTDRKEWLEDYCPNADNGFLTLDKEKEHPVIFTISRHLNTELIKFFHDDCKRSLPHVIDGLKESQRKIVYTAKLKCTKHEIKVAQFAAATAERTAYHHGEQNLANAIVNLAQSFVGSNNLPLFTEGGMFGSRLEGGADAASPRYIFTKTMPYFQSIFNEGEDDLLDCREDDGVKVEPFFYVPVIPLLLVNGSIGIGTGWSCMCPTFNPKDIIHASKLWVKNDPEFKKYVYDLKPWYNGFKGTIKRIQEGSFEINGVYQQTGNTILITELPIGEWTSHFVQWLIEHEIDFTNRSTPDDVNIEVFCTDNTVANAIKKKMKTRVQLHNIVVFNKDYKIQKVQLFDIFNMWGNAKLEVLNKRKQITLEQLNTEKHVLELKLAFIIAVKSKQINLTEEIEDVYTAMNNITTNNEEQKLLLDMNIRSLNLNFSKELQLKIDQLHKDIKLLENKNERDLWFEDIAEFETYFN